MNLTFEFKTVTQYKTLKFYDFRLKPCKKKDLLRFYALCTICFPLEKKTQKEQIGFSYNVCLEKGSVRSHQLLLTLCTLSIYPSVQTQPYPPNPFQGNAFREIICLFTMPFRFVYRTTDKAALSNSLDSANI